MCLCRVNKYLPACRRCMCMYVSVFTAGSDLHTICEGLNNMQHATAATALLKQRCNTMTRCSYDKFFETKPCRQDDLQSLNTAFKPTAWHHPYLVCSHFHCFSIISYSMLWCRLCHHINCIKNIASKNSFFPITNKL